MKRVKLGISAVLIVVAACVCAARIIYVNSTFPAPENHVFSVNEPATYGGESSAGIVLTAGDIQITTSNFRALDHEGIKAAIPSYIDPIIQLGNATDLRVFLVDATFKNTTQEHKDVTLRDYHLTSQAWLNGFHPLLFENFNEDPSTILPVDPGSTETRTLVFMAYNSQINPDRGWNNLAQSDFSLVLALYPDRASISLGHPTPLDAASLDTSQAAASTNDAEGSMV